MAPYSIFELFDIEFLDRVIENILKDQPEPEEPRTSYGADYKKPFEASNLYWFLYKGM